jgi:hypothetical protein
MNRQIPIADSFEELESLLNPPDKGNDRARPYDGQPWTLDGVRGQAEVKGLTMRDIQDCFVKALLLSSGDGRFYDAAINGTWRTSQVYDVHLDNVDPIAISQNLMCEMERMMGIFPNVDKPLY